MAALLGCIADDYTGASDIASQLAEQGVRTVQLFGVPDATTEIDADTQAIIIGLKTRTEKVDSAISDSLKALAFLNRQGCARFYFKYCSTFDSTPKGNIGPVTDALADSLDAASVFFCPAFPKNGRTLYQGHLFVNGALLSESSLATHPLTPMTDANLVRWLSQQTQQRVGLLSFDALDQGIDTARNRLNDLQASDHRYILTDALNDHHLEQLGELCAEHTLVSGGSALAPAMAKAWRRHGLLPENTGSEIEAHNLEGHALILSGSCSEQSNRQVEVWKNQGGATIFLNPEELMTQANAVEDIIHSVRDQLADGPVLVYATSPAVVVKQLQADYGREHLGHKIEQAFVEIARQLVPETTQTLIVAGGETSGAVVSGLNLKALTVGSTIAPGVPWMHQHDTQPLAIALKSGNFGSDTFYQEALQRLHSGVGHE
ncbi:MAG: four-carbon acid sugar kinase family protein [Saccharospirillum sp.]|nr:four-carbon acid sugar kinase family protein [Saccharospirillum sp.]